MKVVRMTKSIDDEKSDVEDELSQMERDHILRKRLREVLG